MDKEHSRDRDDLSDFERRLAGWQPKADGPGADAMLFAAGLAAGRRGPRRQWQAICAVLVVQVVCLGAWGISERSERLALVSQLDKGDPSTAALPQSVGKAEDPGYTPSPNDYFHQRRRVEQDASYYLASAEPRRRDAIGHQSPQARILQAGRWSDLVE